MQQRLIFSKKNLYRVSGHWGKDYFLIFLPTARSVALDKDFSFFFL
jgi:hypothetical protein